MRFPYVLDDVFRTRSHVRILRALDELPRSLGASAREVARRAGVSHPTASSVLSSLAGQGIVTVRRLSRSDSYELNEDHELTTNLRMLFAFERQLFDQLLSFLRKRIGQAAAPASAAFVFGSAARRELTAGSDIDVAVVCPAYAIDQVREAMDEVADEVHVRFGNRLNALIASGSVSELRRRGRRGSRLWDRILREGIDLLSTAATEGKHG